MNAFAFVIGGELIIGQYFLPIFWLTVALRRMTHNKNEDFDGWLIVTQKSEPAFTSIYVCTYKQN